MRQARSSGAKRNKKPPRKLRILIATYDKVAREGVRHLLDSQGWEICGDASDGVVAVEKTQELKPDVVILNLGMPRLSGLDATRQILERNPLQKILMLTEHASSQVIRECHKAGVQGLVSKSDPAEDVCLAVRALAVNRTFFAKAVRIPKKLTATAS